jgi:penicillin-binding protein 1A
MGASTALIALGIGVYLLEAMTQESMEEVLTYAPPGTLTIKANDGKVLQEIGPVSHDLVKMGRIPPLVEQAFVASEDRRFQDHRGVDFQGIARAIFSNLQAGELVEGGSTITQQLARLVFLTQERTFDRKIREVRLAQKIEATFPKEQILARYLNLVYLGSGAYGVADAAWAYFSKTPEQLTLGEAATLAGVVPAPSLYSPLVNLNAATTRRNAVLTTMAEAGFITPQQAQQAMAQPLVVKPSPLKRFGRTAPFFTDYILQELGAKIPESKRQLGGITVMTTLNPAWQTQGEAILKKSVEEYGRWQGFSEGALVALDPRTGAIKVMVGGKDYQSSQFNRVTQAQRQPGSTFKPILYATAIAAGISPNRAYLNSPFTVNGYTPENYGDSYTGGWMPLREALTNSVNVVAVRLLLDVGWNPVITTARKMGLQSKLEPTYSLALGAWEMTPLEMTSAYGTFANKGVHVSPYAIQQVVDSKGQVLYKAQHQQQVALDPGSNAIMTSFMRSVVTSGTGRPAQLGNRQVAGKTGTSDEAKDLWFIGYIPQLVTGVWLGNDNSKPTRGASSTAASIWGQFMTKTTEAMPVQYFPPLPKPLEGRKPTIQAEPIRRRRITLLAPVNSSGPEQVTSPATETPRRRRRRRRELSKPQEPATQGTRQAAPRAALAPAPSISEPSVASPQASSSELPAPPAAHKSEPASE